MITVGVLLNLENLAGAQIRGYNFNSMCVFNGKLLGAGADGISEIGGVIDNSTAISAFFEIPQTDLGISENKRVREVVVDGYTKGSFTMTTVIDETEKTVYTVNGTGAYANSSMRIEMNSNDSGRLVGFKFANTSGSDFSIRSIFALLFPTMMQHDMQTGALGRAKVTCPMATGSASGS